MGVWECAWAQGIGLDIPLDYYVFFCILSQALREKGEGGQFGYNQSPGQTQTNA